MSSISRYNYSVIIPFRGSLQLLEKACASVPLRSDIQVLVIDNSAEYVGSEAIAAFGNPNIQYLTSSPDKGAGCARNVGLEHAEGKYLLFLDADDYFTPDAFDAFDAKLDSNIDIIFFNATSIVLSTGALSKRHSAINNIIKSFMLTNCEDELRFKYCNPCAKMVRRNFVMDNKIKFQEVPAGNDQMFSTWIGYYANEIMAIDKVVYVITEGEVNTSLTKVKSLKHQESRFKVDIDYNEFMKSIGRKDLVCRINPEIIKAFYHFGFKTGFNWMKYALTRK